MKSQSCCFTGHRSIPDDKYDELKTQLKETVSSLAERGMIYFYAGGAMGFDALAAAEVLLQKQKYPDIKLMLALPCRNQTDGWKDNDARLFEYIHERADSVIYTSLEYSAGCMQKRNRFMVEASSVCVCYKTRASGGTAYTVRFAEKTGVEVINLG